MKYCPECASQRLDRIGFKGTGHTIVKCRDCELVHEVKEVTDEQD